jgi:hypothetical protein
VNQVPEFRGSVSAAHRAVRTVLRGVSTATMSLGVAALLLTTACYTYDVRSPGDIAPGQHIVVTVNNIGRVALAADLGDDVATVEGDLTSTDSAGIHMRVTAADFTSGTSTPMAGVAVVVPNNAVVMVSTKQFSRSKTAAVVIGIGAAIVAAIRAFGILGSGNGGPTDKPPQPIGTS